MGQLRFALKNFILIAIVFTASLYLAVSGRITAIIVGVCLIIGGFRSFGKVADASTIVMIILGIGVIIVGATLKKFDNVLKYIGAAALAYTAFYQYMKIDKKFSPNKPLKIVETIALLVFPSLIIAGIAISIFTKQDALGRALIISGCSIWLVHTIYALIFMDSRGEPKIGFSGNSGRTKSIGNYDSENACSEQDIYRKVREVADRWDHTTLSLAYGTHIRLNISVEVGYDTVNFTVGGTMQGLQNLENESYLNGVKSDLQSNLARISNNIITTAQGELNKMVLPHEFNISIELGELD